MWLHVIVVARRRVCQALLKRSSSDVDTSTVTTREIANRCGSEAQPGPRLTRAVRRSSFVLGLGVLTVLGAGCGSGDQTTRDETGSIVEGGDVSVFRLQVGDCVGGGTVGELTEMEAVPCDETHQAEVYYLFDVPDGEFPGEEVLDTQAAEGCLGAFEDYVGIDYESSIYGVNYLQPSAESWDAQDDREIVCMMGHYDESLKTGSAKDAGV